MNERSVVRVLQQHGPCSRADMTRRLGVTAPTVSKAVSSLLQGGLVEEYDHKHDGIGRPAKRLRLATERAQVLGLVIDAHTCRLVSAGLDGELHDDSIRTFATPKTYRGLISKVLRVCEQLIEREQIATLGMGISMPGLIDHRTQAGVQSPNCPITDGKAPARDLSELLGIECVLLQEAHALCLAERHYGENDDTRSLDNFAMMDVGTGLGLGIVSGGRVLTGHGGLAGEIGHIPREADGHLCGCGKLGCLETLASESAFLRQLSARLERDVSLNDVKQLVADGVAIDGELNEVASHLAFAVSTVISLFNPSTLFLSSQLFDIDGELFDRLIQSVSQQTLKPSFTDCRVVRAHGSKRQGAIAGVIEYLTDSLVPGMDGMVRQNGFHSS